MKPLHIRMSITQGQFAKHILAKAKEEELLPGQPKIMEYLEHHDGCTQAEICGVWDLDKSTVSGLIERMERDGLLSVERDGEDRRRKVLHLTSKGKEKWSIMKACIVDLDETAFLHVTEDEKEVFYKVLDCIYKNIKQI